MLRKSVCYATYKIMRITKVLLRVNMVLSLTEIYHSVMRTAIMQIGNYKVHNI